MYTFLATLPAILGFVAFAVYQLLARHTQGDRVTHEILNHIRPVAPDLVEKYESLPPAKRERLIKQDQKLRKLMSDQDFRLLQQTLRQQYVVSMVVYSLSSFLVLTGALLFVYTLLRPEPTSISDIFIIDEQPTSRGLLVDLDPLDVIWKADGKPTDVNVYLENLENGKQSIVKRAASSQAKIKFLPEDYVNILANRRKDGVNRIRSVVVANQRSFKSNEFSMHVGIKISVVGTPEEVTVMARIDNTPLAFYDFEANVVIPRKKGIAEFVTLNGFKYNDNHRSIERPDDLAWHDIRVVYFGPDDPRLVRPEFLGLATGGW